MWTPPYKGNAELTQPLLRETNSPFGEAKSSVLAGEWGAQERRGERGQEGTGGTLSSGAGIATSRTSYLFHAQNTTFLHPADQPMLRHLSHLFRQAGTQLYIFLTPTFNPYVFMYFIQHCLIWCASPQYVGGCWDWTGDCSMFALAVVLWIRMLVFWIVIAFGNCRKLTLTFLLNWFLLAYTIEWISTLQVC